MVALIEREPVPQPVGDGGRALLHRVGECIDRLDPEDHTPLTDVGVEGLYAEEIPEGVHPLPDAEEGRLTSDTLVLDQRIAVAKPLGRVVVEEGTPAREQAVDRPTEQWHLPSLNGGVQSHK